MNDPGIDLTGKLIIKVALGDDIRRILITNEDITYDELVLMMQRVYRGKLGSNDDIVIKYKDEDNDLITIFDSSDLNFAIQCSRILKITLFVNGKPEPLQTDEVKMIKSEVKHIRDRCNQLLDKLDDRQSYDRPSSTVDSSSSKVMPPKVSESPQRASPRPSFVPPTSQVGSKEFDPLSSQRAVEDQQNKVMSSFGIPNDERPGTPDSISSIGSSSSRQQQQPQGSPAQQSGQASPYPTAAVAGSGQKLPPWQQPTPGQPSPYQGPHGYTTASTPQQQPAVYPTQTSLPGPGQSQTSQYGPGYSQQAQPATQQVQASQQPGAQPGQQQGVYQQPGYGMVTSQQQPMSLPSQQQQQVPPGQAPQQQQQVPQGSPYGYQQQVAGAPPAQAPPGTANPYARQGPGYGAGYPRPTGNYPQGYQ